MESNVPSSSSGTMSPGTSGVLLRTSSRSEEEDLKKQMMEEWKASVSNILGKKGTDYWKINHAIYERVGKPSQGTFMSGLLKSEKTEQDGKACRIARGLVFKSVNDKGDIRGNMIIENHSDRATAFMVSGSNGRNYNITPRVGKIPPGASIVVEITANLKAFTEETPLERDYFYAEILKTSAEHSTGHQIMRTFNNATSSSIEGYYVDKLMLLNLIADGENYSNDSDSDHETDENESDDESFDETIDPAVPYTGQRPRNVSSKGEGVNYQLAADAERLKKSGGHFVTKADWFGFIFIFLCLLMGFGGIIGYKLYYP